MVAERIVRVFAIAVALLTTRTVLASAQSFNMAEPGSYQALSQCSENKQSYFPGDADAPPPVAAILASRPDLSFRTCTDLDRNTHYFLRMTWPKIDGVCRYFAREIFPTSPRDKIWLYPDIARSQRGDNSPISGWSIRVPRAWKNAGYRLSSEEVFAAVTERPCPPAGDATYFRAPHLSNGMVKTIVGFWRSITTSPQALTNAFANISGRDDATMKRFKKAVFGGSARIDSADCDQYATGCRMVVTANDSYAITFDFGQGGLVPRKLEQVPLI